MSAALPSLTGPRLEAARGGSPESLVIFVHGYGADGNDLIGIGRVWQQVLTASAFVAPNGPDRCPGSPGYQWFPITRLDPTELWTGVQYAGPILDAFIDAEMARTALPASKIFLVGFSQGTMLSLHVGLRRKEALGAIIGYSGALAGPEELPAALGSKPPIFLAHGDADPVVPPQATPLAASQLGELGVPVIWHMSEGVGHGIDQISMEAGCRFVNDALAGTLDSLQPGQRLP